MAGLLRRSDGEQPGRPYQLAALSGRRAARDGEHRLLGGPERAGVKRLGEALSAGRVAAPGQFPRETLGRGHSAARVTGASAQRAKPAALVGPVEARPCERAGLGLFQAMARAVVVLGLFVGPAAGATFVKPGDTGSLTWTIENDSASGAPMTNVSISVTISDPAKLSQQQTSQLGPVASIPPGGSHAFQFDYAVAANADGEVTVTLKSNQDTQFVTDRDAETSVSLPTKTIPVLYGRAA